MFGRRFYREREQLALRLDEVVRGYLSDARVPAVTDWLGAVYGEFAVGTHPETREMRFFLDDLACFTPDLANRLQRLVADEFPAWTVVPQFDEWTFTVAARAVVFPAGTVRGRLTADEPAYVEWLAGARAFDAARYGPVRRQVARVRPLVPAALPRLAAERAVVLAAFDHYRPPPYAGHAVWLLLPPEDSYVPDAAAKYAVDAGGVVYPEFARRFVSLGGEEPAGWLVTVVTEQWTPWVELPLGSADPVARVGVPRPMSDDQLRREANG